MCGIILFIRYGKNWHLSEKTKLYNAYKTNNSGIVLTKDIPDLEDSSLFCSIDSIDYDSAWNSMRERGPDFAKGIKIGRVNGNWNTLKNQVLHDSEEFRHFFSVEIEPEDIEVYFVSSILRMRKTEHPIFNMEQPIIEDGIALAYNGEIYSINSQGLEQELPLEIVNHLETFSKETHDTEFVYILLRLILKHNIEIDILSDLINGDFSFVVFYSPKNKIYIIKDSFGKRSLTFTRGDCFTAFSSVSLLNTDKMNTIRLDVSLEESLDFDVLKISGLEELANIANQQKVDKIKSSLLSKYFDNYISILKRWTIEVPGNSIITLEISHEDLLLSTSMQPFDIKFDRLTNGPIHERGKTPTIEEAVAIVDNILRKSMKELLINIIDLGTLVEQPEGVSNSKIGVLFSGGLDSSLIAFYAAISIPDNETIDLINVSFTQNSHDRKIAIESYHELTEILGDSKFNLILVDTDYAEAEAIRLHTYQRIYPQCTFLDFNIGNVLYFASTGKGHLYPNKDNAIKSGARCLLDGLGADEIFCGYRRYRTAFLRGGNIDMLKEMQFGNNNIHSRYWKTVA